MSIISRLIGRYREWKHRRARTALQDAAQQSDGDIGKFFEGLEEDDRVNLQWEE